MKRRTAGRALLLLLAAANILLGGSWFLGGRFLPRLQRLAATATLLVREKAPHLSDLLGLTEPQTPVQEVPGAAPPPPPLRRAKTAEELRVEGLIDATFQEYFREYTIGGRRLTVRMPFALNGERPGSPAYSQDFYYDGKGTPATLWPYIDRVLASKAFAKYAARISRPGEKAVVFTLQRRAYQVSSNRQVLDALDQDSYPGTPTRIFIRRNGDPVSEADVYNYLYAVSAVGVDCSGFAYHLLETIAGAYGLDLDQALAPRLGVGPREVRKRVGIRFFDPAQGHTERVADRIEDLRPGDLLLFRGSDGAFKHSAVIQSIDLENGVIRYVQSTDWAVEEDRGVHLSTIHFDPSRARESLAHYSVRWLQQVRPPFEGEKEPRNWRTDRDRYLWYTDVGGSMVVRLRLLASALVMADPRYYAAFPGETPAVAGTAALGATSSWTPESP
jgi:hypothetical protein